MTQYVVGFLFCPKEERVALIRKARPQWQKGKLNGIGGHIEEGEITFDAMCREFREETGMTVTIWRYFAKLIVDSQNTVYFFRATSREVPDKWSISTGDDEPIEVLNVNTISNRVDVVNDVHWLIPMAKSLHEKNWPFLIYERFSFTSAISHDAYLSRQ